MVDFCGTGNTGGVVPSGARGLLDSSDPLAAGLLQLWVCLKTQDFEAAIARFALLCATDPGKCAAGTIGVALDIAAALEAWQATEGDAARLQAALDRMNDGDLGGSGVPGDA